MDTRTLAAAAARGREEEETAVCREETPKRTLKGH
jgi:hypothetical protein